MEVGSIIQYSGLTAPENFLVCDGSAVSRTDYADLYDVIGTTYGSGDGSTTFNLPDLSGRLVVGISQSHVLAATGGETSHTLLTSELPSHTHTVPSHGHGNNITAATPSLSHSITQQPSFTYTQLNGGTNGWAVRDANFYNSRTSAAMSRSTNVAITAHAATACTMSGGVTDCAELTAGDAGSGAAHNNMMPYLALTYLIRYAPDVPPGPKMAYYNGALPVGPLGGYISGITR